MRCTFCGKDSVVNKSGVFHFEVPELDDGYPNSIDIPDGEWTECDACGEILMNKKINEEINNWQYQRRNMLLPEEVHALRCKYIVTLEKLHTFTDVAIDRLDRYELGLIIPKKEEADKIRQVLEYWRNWHE